MSKYYQTSGLVNIGIFFSGMIIAFFMSYQLYFSQTASVGDAITTSVSPSLQADVIGYRDENSLSLQTNKDFVFREKSMMRIEIFMSDDMTIDDINNSIQTPYPYTISVGSGMFIIVLDIGALLSNDVVLLHLHNIVSDLIVNKIELFDQYTIDVLSLSMTSVSDSNHISF